MEIPTDTLENDPENLPQRSEEDPRLIPLSWKSGSEEELRLLARAICHLEPDLFDGQNSVTAVFRAGTDRKRGGFIYVARDGDRYGATLYITHYVTPLLTSLCELAFRLNPFIGTQWSAFAGYEKQIEPVLIRVRVEAPSAHDTAEALLTLVEWLNDKLHNPKKRAWAGLPAHTLDLSHG